jgi:hypothetical protein
MQEFSYTIKCSDYLVQKARIRSDRRGIKIQVRFCDDTEFLYESQWCTLIFKHGWTVKNILIYPLGDIVVKLTTHEENVEDKERDIDDILDRMVRKRNLQNPTLEKPMT